ncbi:MAG: hypothetical protein GY765_25250, partial [bacterium]|nr:hypothetical protein [bacterium]
QFSKKLTLSKQTITNLENNDLDNAKGGAPNTYYCTKPGVCPSILEGGQTCAYGYTCFSTNLID